MSRTEERATRRDVAPTVKARTHGAALRLKKPSLRASVAEVKSAPTSATSRATVSLCVHHLQHCVQLRDAVCDFHSMNFHLYSWFSMSRHKKLKSKPFNERSQEFVML